MILFRQLTPKSSLSIYLEHDRFFYSIALSFAIGLQICMFL